MENVIYAKFNPEGYVDGFWQSAAYDPPEGEGRNPIIPHDAIEITPQQYDELMSDPSTRKWVNGEVVDAGPRVLEGFILPVPQFISDRQFAQQLAKMGLITKAEALEWVKAGVVPAAFDAFVQSLPVDQQFDAEMLLSGATQFDRYHQFTETFGAARDMTPDQIDQLWRDAATL
jgi:hypothetical protein